MRNTHNETNRLIEHQIHTHTHMKYTQSLDPIDWHKFCSTLDYLPYFLIEYFHQKKIFYFHSSPAQKKKRRRTWDHFPRPAGESQDESEETKKKKKTLWKLSTKFETSQRVNSLSYKKNKVVTAYNT